MDVDIDVDIDKDTDIYIYPMCFTQHASIAWIMPTLAEALRSKDQYNHFQKGQSRKQPKSADIEICHWPDATFKATISATSDTTQSQPVSNDKKLSSHSSGKNSRSKADSSVLGASGST